MNLIDKQKKLPAYINSKFLSLYTFAGQEKVRQLNLVLIAGISFILIFILNRLHPLFGDDWMYSMLPEPSNEHVKNFPDILYTQYEHYFTWGGRSVVHIIAQTLLLLGKLPADILNSLAYVALTLVIYLFANKGKKANPGLLIGINLLIFFFQPAFGSTMLWKTGSANYLWGTLIIASFLLLYRVYLPKNKDNIKLTVLFFLFGIIAGWTNENMGVALIVMLVLLLFYLKSDGTKIPRWFIAGLAGAIIGCAFMIAAPGNYARMGMVSEESSPVLFLIGRFFAAIAAYYYYSLGLSLVFALLFCIARSYTKPDINKRLENSLVTILIIGAIVATLAMSASPIFPGRAIYGINTLLILSSAILFANLDFSKFLVKRISSILIIFGLLFFLSDYYRGCRELSHASKVYEERTKAVVEGKASEEQDIILHEIIAEPETGFFHHFDLSHDSLDWHNRMYSRYYDIHSVKVIPNK